MLKLVTVATHSNLYFPILNNYCKKNNIKLHVLGWGKTYNNHHFKDDQIIKFTETCDEKDIVMFLDGFDSMITDRFNDEQIIKLFQKVEKN